MNLPGTAHTVALHVNGIDYNLQLEARVSLLDALRESIGLLAQRRAVIKAHVGMHGPGGWRTHQFVFRPGDPVPGPQDYHH